MRFGPPGDRQFGAAGSLFEVILSLFEVILGALEGHWATFGVFFFPGVGKKAPNSFRFGGQSGPKGTKMDPRRELKSSQNRSGNRSKFRWLFLSPFWWIWGHFRC